MNRRLFCQFPLVASAILANARSAHAAQDSRPPHDPGPRKGFKVEAGKDRFQEELLIMGGQFDCKVSAKDTGGALCIYDTYRDENGGPGWHMHYHQDEWFFAMEGEFVFKVGDDLMHLKPGDAAFAPRQVPHTFAMTSGGRGHMLILFQPAGSMEDFFLQMSKLGKSIPTGQETAMRTLFKTHGMELLGPPLKV